MRKTGLLRVAACAALLGLTTAGARADVYTEGYDLAMGGDYATAYSKWLPLAVHGDGRAQFNLALMYHGGLFVEPNERVAVHWYRKAAENGIREAQEYMYVGYKEGWFGLPHDEKRAAYWEQRLSTSGL